MKQVIPASQDERETAARVFLQSCGWASAEMTLLAADASFRRYFRILKDGKQAVLMDAPPQHENAESYLRVSEQLTSLGLSAPRAKAQDLTRGFLLLEDFGDHTFTRALAEGAKEEELYELAVETLVTLHQRWQTQGKGGLPSYDLERLLQEADLFVDWYLPAIGVSLSDSVRRDYFAAWRTILQPLTEKNVLPTVLVLRDFHVDNLMLLPNREGVASCGLLDFQDAVLGSPAYDLVSLLRDARRDVPGPLHDRLLTRYLDSFPDWPRDTFERHYWSLGAHRSARIIGVFTRLARRDDKPRYLEHLPRLWRLLEEELARPELAPLRDWLACHVPSSVRRRPDTDLVSNGVSS